MRWRWLVVAVVLVLAGCSGQAASEGSAPGTTAPKDQRAAACDVKANAALTAMRNYLQEAPGALQSSDRQAAAQRLRDDAEDVRGTIAAARTYCRDLLPECPASNDPLLDWITANVDYVEGTAKALEGGTPTATEPPAEMPAPQCY